MKTYTKPSVNVIELTIEENIAAIVPKTVYKRSSATKYTYQSTVNDFDAGSLPTTGFGA